jgi:lipoprotein-anchoring transpeptidase ErfK/SrfK
MMGSFRSYNTWRHIKIFSFMMSIIVILSFLLSACKGDIQSQGSANRSKDEFDKEIIHARSIGIPNTLLQSIENQRNALSQTHAPFTIFYEQPTSDYYTNLAKRYQMLTVQTRGLEEQLTQQFAFQAVQALKDFQNILTQRQAQGTFNIGQFVDQYTLNQTQINQAQTPRDFLQIESNAKKATQTLHFIGAVYDTLSQLQDQIQQLQASNIDTSLFDQQAQDDTLLLQQATTTEDFRLIMTQINAQLQGAATRSSQASPYVGATQIQQLRNQINEMQRYGLDTTSYQQHLANDEATFKKARSLSDYVQFSTQIEQDSSSVRIPLLQGKARYLVQQFHQEVSHWGDTHHYLDPYNNISYRLGYEYGAQGIGANLEKALQTARTADDFQAVVDLATNDMTNFQALEANYQSTTPWNQTHIADTQLMQYYKTTSGTVIVVSLIEQTERVYQNGRLVRALQIVTGQPGKPSLPGFWKIFLRLSPTIFRSFDPPGSAFYYPNTPITFAMEYHGGGYFFHDSTWRAVYGQYSNFPHADPTGNISATVGTHGCFNMRLEDADWLYHNTGYSTPVIVY